MSITDIIAKYGGDKDEKTMLMVTDMVSDFLKDNVSEELYSKVCKDIYSMVAGGHYNEEFAKKQIPKMYYADSEGKKHYAPYWTDAEVEEIYKLNKSNIPDAYNLYDFMVTLNMIKSDYHNILEGWFEGANNEKRYIELAINWLDDDDNPFGEEKVWKYFNS